MANTIVAKRREAEQICARLKSLGSQIRQTASSLRPTALDGSSGAGADALAELSAAVVGLGSALVICTGACESMVVSALQTLEQADADAARSMR